MYKVLYNGLVLHDPSLQDRHYILTDVSLVQEASKADQLVFHMYPDHANYNSLQRLRTGSVEVFNGDRRIFRGRILNDDREWLNDIVVTCEGDLAMLNDTVVRPYEFSGSPGQYLEMLITQHNQQVPAEKQFTVREVTVTDPNDYIVRSSEQYPKTFSEITEKLVNSLGGYLIAEYKDGINYLDYLEDIKSESGQTIQLAKNLMTFSRTSRGENIATGLIPLGHKNDETGERVNIKSVNRGLDYIVNEEAAAKYGLIFAQETWDDVTIPANLLRKANIRLKELSEGTSTIELSAVDLNLRDKDIDALGFLQYVNCEDPVHGFTGRFLITKKQTDLCNPAGTVITIGETMKGITSFAVNSRSDVIRIVEDYGTIGTSVKSETRYFCLVDENAAAPAVPTTSPPSFFWSESPPDFDLTKCMYTVIRTLYSDDTWSYSAVYLSSDYEAAKAAYKNADEAKESADGAKKAAEAAGAAAERASWANEVIVGTQSTQTAAWTGKASFDELKDGQSILYWLPQESNTNVTLNLTSSTGKTTGAKPCYYSGTVRLGTHYSAGNVIRMLYRKNVTIGGTTITEGWWADANYNTDTYDRIKLSTPLTSAAAIGAGRLGAINAAGKLVLLSTTPFDITQPIVYIGSAYTSGATSGNNYIAWGTSFPLTNTKVGFTGTAGQPVYVVGTLNGKIFTPDENVFTTTAPTSADGKTYILIGQMATKTDATLYPEHPMFRYIYGKFQSTHEAAYEAYVSAEMANGNIGTMANDIQELKDETAENIAAAIADLESRILGENGELAKSKDDLNQALAGFREALESQKEELIGMLNNLNTQYVTSFDQLFDFIRFINADNFKGIEIGPITVKNASDSSPIQIRIGQYNFTGTGWKNLIMLYENDDNFGWWDGKDFHTGNIYVELSERAQFGPISIVPRSDGTIMFLYTGGDS